MSTTESIDYAAYIAAVARRLCGNVNKALSDKTTLRFGTRGSMAVQIAGDKRGTWFDHENNVGGGVLDLLHHKLGFANGEAVEWLQNELGAPKSKAKPQIATAYDYVDEAGELLFQVVRFEPKDFRQRRPDGHNGWIWKLGETRIVPYRLPSLIAAIEDDRTVYIPEGEKDVDRLREIGFTATCNPGGVGKWRNEFAALFRGADVVVVPDNDDAGRKHASAVAASLQGIAKRLRYLELPSLPPKGDVSDWIAAGGNSAALMRLAEAAPEWKSSTPEEPRPEDDAGLGEWDAGDDDAPIEPRAWLLGNVFCRRYVSSLVGSSGVGKTAVRVAQLLSAAIGRPLTNEHIFQRCRVLIISLEDDKDELRRRVRAAMIHYGVTNDDIRGWLFLATPASLGLKLATTENGAHKAGALEAKLVETINRRRIDIISIDPFVKSHAVEENANGAIDFVAGILARIAIGTNCAVDAPHHVSKGPADPGNADRSRGASAFIAAVRLAFTLSPMTAEEAETFGIGEEERRQLIRTDTAKVNITPAAAKATWFRLVGVRIGNPTELYPNGDEVQTVEPWQPPEVWDGLSHHLLNDILTTIDKGLSDGNRYSDHSAAKDRAAWKAVMQHAPDKTEKQAREIVRTWVKNGLLTMEEYIDPMRREPTKGLKVNNAKRPS